MSSVASAAQKPAITDAERGKDADRKNIHSHPHSRPSRQADHRLWRVKLLESGETVLVDNGDGTRSEMSAEAFREMAEEDEG